jgi:predicted DNA-binding ribbon-helix-helix protein
MKSLVLKRSIVIVGHKTSVSLEDAFWRALKEIAFRRQMTLSSLVGSIDAERQHGNLSSAIRLFVIEFYRVQCIEATAARMAAQEAARMISQEVMRNTSQEVLVAQPAG